MKGLTLQDLKIHELYRASRKQAPPDGMKLGIHGTEKKDKKANVVKSMIEELILTGDTVEEVSDNAALAGSTNPAIIIKDD